ncbi:hypothetical protein GGD83_004887 [Rhodoblastus sphagnicola]|uniref:hypothetical protein n=1 Tax=Rhodoblastus sphagnicola TaxID=333368 RepID=UPI001304F6C1|nr:hypothetical protein [Rhodoblastus sphagnicola]MBB4201057.1 hypothetical protein [Rhodoblastus sphagnicola]
MRTNVNSSDPPPPESDDEVWRSIRTNMKIIKVLLVIQLVLTAGCFAKVFS